MKINSKTKDISSGIVVQRGNTSTDCFRPSVRSCEGILLHVEIAFLLPIAGRAGNYSGPGLNIFFGTMQMR